MILRTGNMWDFESEYDCMLVTTNAEINKSGELVMGKGAAKELKGRSPNFPRIIAEEIDNRRIYGMIMLGKYGVFQVKFGFRERARLDLIAYSCGMLVEMASIDFMDTFSLNFPGIGWGGLKYDDVFPFVNTLPDNVEVWVNG